VWLAVTMRRKGVTSKEREDGDFYVIGGSQW
jgi:hypothetical protein